MTKCIIVYSVSSLFLYTTIVYIWTYLMIFITLFKNVKHTHFLLHYEKSLKIHQRSILKLKKKTFCDFLFEYFIKPIKCVSGKISWVSLTRKGRKFI